MLLETPDVLHDVILAGNITGFVNEAEDAVRQAHDFFRQ